MRRMDSIDGGYRINETATHYIDIMEMMFNWRLCAVPKDLPVVVDRAYCYIGKDSTTFCRAVLAGWLWDDIDEDPIGWDKDAMRQRYSESYRDRTELEKL